MRLHGLGFVLLSAIRCSHAVTQAYLGNLNAAFQDSESNVGVETDKSVTQNSESWIRNATDNLLFTSIASLLQQWPNTRYRNGHTIIKGTVPAGTTLYHARGDKDIPLVPEWTGFNVEHSYLLCPRPECWMLTLRVEDTLNIVYFDGSSAANSYLGHQDSQDVVLWGRVRKDKMAAEWERLDELCRWGQPFNIDGFVRMEPGFEVMLCDFTKKITVVSSVHIMGPKRDPPGARQGPSDILHHRQSLRFYSSDKPPLPFPPHKPRPNQPLPPGWKGPLMDQQFIGLAAIHAAAWNSFYPGEVRARLDYTRFISFYDPTYTSLLTARDGVARNRHRLLNISNDDLQLAMAQLNSDFSREDDHSSGIDWPAMMRAVTDRYADRLHLLKDVLAVSNVQRTNATAVASAVRQRVMVMLTPYLVYGALPIIPLEGGVVRNTSWVEPITFYCESSLTSAIQAESITRSERLIKTAVEGVLHRICSSLTHIWVDAFAATTVSDRRAAELIPTWRDELDQLMQWLDWPMWDICRPSCPEDMFCYIQTWPWGVPWTEEDPDKIDMRPRCIDRETGDLGPHDHLLGSSTRPSY